MTQPHELTALEQAAALRRRELSAVDLTEHALRRIDALDAKLGAFVTVTPDRALAAARAADVRLGDGEKTPLLGVPTAIKDLAMTAGVPTAFGSPVYAGFVPDVDDDAARLLADAGLVSLGKTSTPEFGLPPYTEPADGRPAVTPWDPGRSAGGSSGGAAAAVAAGLVAVAHATDGGGSIRIPAACCGLVGLKTSRGLVSRGPTGGDPLGMSVSGPLARTVTDAAALLDALAVTVPGEPYPLLAARPEPFLAAARGAAPRRLRIGRYATPPVPDAVVEPACRDAYERASALLAGLGHDVVEFDPGLDAERSAGGASIGAGFLPVFEVLWAVLAHSHPVRPRDEPRLAPLTRWWRDRGARISGPEYLAATQAALRVTRQVVARQAAVDVVLTPMLAQLPRPLGWFTDGGDPAEDFARQRRFTPFTAIYNVTGQPALSLPVTRSGDLPVSVQLVGRAGDDALLLELGAELDAASGRDVTRRPMLW